MKVAAYILILLILYVAWCSIGFHYPVWVNNPVLHNPVHVLSFENNILRLENGKRLNLIIDRHYYRDDSLTQTLQRSGYNVDIESAGKDGFLIYASCPRFKCGRPWAYPIRLPIFPDRINQNLR